MINEKQNKRISKFLSLVLRHAPDKIGIELDNAGWTYVEDLLEKMNANGMSISMEILEFVVDTNNKKRFSFDSTHTKIRANQGHSIEIQHGFQAIEPPQYLFHGTSDKSIDNIKESGIKKMQRHHVHLSADESTAINVGGRHGKPIVLTIMSKRMFEAGHIFYRSDNKVWLTDQVPVEFIEGLS